MNDTLAGNFEFKVNSGVRQACQAVADMLTQFDAVMRDTVESVTRQGLRRPSNSATSSSKFGAASAAS